jgi:hypothetical protein
VPVKFFIYCFDSTLGAFDDGPLIDFVRDKEVLAFREHFFAVADVPHLACVVTYQETVVPPEALAEARAIAAARPSLASTPLPPPSIERGPRGDRDRPDPTAGMTESDRTLFNTLRDWRMAAARREGMPPYVLFSNRELARIVAVRPDNLARLGQIEGIGPGKVERYGAVLLAVLHGGRVGTPPAASGADAAAAPRTESIGGVDPATPGAAEMTS